MSIDSRAPPPAEVRRKPRDYEWNIRRFEQHASDRSELRSHRLDQTNAFCFGVVKCRFVRHALTWSHERARNRVPDRLFRTVSRKVENSGKLRNSRQAKALGSRRHCQKFRAAERPEFFPLVGRIASESASREGTNRRGFVFLCLELWNVNL